MTYDVVSSDLPSHDKSVKEREQVRDTILIRFFNW
jgi:hypothetical protein